MEETAETSGSNEPLTLMKVLELVLASVEGSWMKSLIRSRRAAAVAARLARASARIAVLLARFQAGEVLWRAPRVKPVAETVPQPDAVIEGGKASETPVPPRRKRAYRLPSAYGWLAETLPVTAVFHCQNLIAAMEHPDMQALMQATPEVAWIMRPIFRMLALEDDVLKVPEACAVANMAEVTDFDGSPDGNDEPNSPGRSGGGRCDAPEAKKRAVNAA